MKTILITGGSDGLGKALAADLAKEYSVVILANDPGQCSAVAAELACTEAIADVADYAQVARAVEEAIAKHGGIDVLVNCAGIYAEGPFEMMEPARMKALMDVNALGTMNVTRAVLPHLLERGEGKIINVISQSGLYPRADHAVYAASKWAVTGFTKSLIEALKGTRIAVTGVYPGPIKTKLFEKAGLDVDTTGFLEPAAVVDAIRTAIDAPPGESVTEIGLIPSPYAGA